MKLLHIRSCSTMFIILTSLSVRVMSFTPFKKHNGNIRIIASTQSRRGRRYLHESNNNMNKYADIFHNDILQRNQLYSYSNSTPRYYNTSTKLNMGKPKAGSIVESYQTVSVNCKKCQTRLFRYKKKNGTKSNLVKCYIERISEDCVGLVAEKDREKDETDDTSSSGGDGDWICPNCQTRFGRDSMIHGRPAIKMVGGKIQMKKK